MQIHPNVGDKDRMIRIGAGSAIILLGAVMGSWWGLIGIVPIATGVLRWCPAYVPLKMSTCESGACCGHGEDKGKTSEEKAGEAKAE